MRKQKCTQCGCKRSVMIKARVRIQEVEMEAGLNVLCLYCFLQMFTCFDKYNFKIDRDAVMRTIE